MSDQTPVDQEAVAKPHRSIAAALAAAQSEMGRAKKSAKNPHFKTKYADLESVCDAALPALNRHGIAVVQPLEARGDQWVQITRFVHGESGETMETPIPLIIGKNDMQGLGSAMTYARRYGLMALAGIAPEDDDGNAAAESVRRAPPEPAGPSKAEVDAACAAMTDAADLGALKDAFYALPLSIKSTPAVIAAKDARKAELEPPAEPSTESLADQLGDEIPYGGPNG